MKPWLHFLFSSLLAATLYPVFNWNVLTILAGGFIIDIDHYFWYIYKYRKLNIFECYRHYAAQFEKYNWEKNIGILLAFHTIEFLLAMAFLSLYNKFVLMFLIGMSFHYLLDVIWHFYGPKKAIANHSIIWWVIKNKVQGT